MTQQFDKATDKPLPQNPNAAMIEMMYIIDNFRSVMVRESEMLETADARGFLSLQDDKLAVARRYERGMSDLLSRKDQIRAADPTLRQRLEAMQKAFHDVTLRNLNGLERMRNGTQRLHEKIMIAARDTAINEQRFAYGAGGTMQKGGRASIGISEQV
jgi:hypothetical protein